MRISDWSSDVCSSDLGDLPDRDLGIGGQVEQRVHRQRNDLGLLDRFPARAHVGVGDQRIPEFVADQRADRSEEHTSELQSLMRISYAVFCLKKKTHTPQPDYLITNPLPPHIIFMYIIYLTHTSALRQLY